MRISLSEIMNPEEGLESVANQMDSRIRDNVLLLPSSVGEGRVVNIPLLDGLVLSCMSFKFREETVVDRAKMPNSNQLPVIFYSDRFCGEQTIQGAKLMVGSGTMNGVFMLSPGIETQWSVPGGQWFFFVNLCFDRNRMRSLIDTDGRSYLGQRFESTEPFFVFETLTNEMRLILQSIKDTLDEKTPIRTAKFLFLSIRLFSIFIARVEQRSNPSTFPKIDPTSVKKMFEVDLRIRESLPDSVSVTELAHDAGMCVSKLQKCFKQVFGVTISAYALVKKMELAKNLLDSQAYTVTEVGTKLGYSNLAHFARSFRSFVGMNPSEYLNRSS